MDTPPPTEITPPPSTSPLRLQDRIAIVTGGASGIGRAICLAYHRAGAKVVIADLQAHSLASTESPPTHELIVSEGGTADFMAVDVTSASSIDALVMQTVQRYGRLDIMVNNAGVSLEGDGGKPIWAASGDAWDKTLAVNGTGVFYGCRAAARQMITQEPLPGGERGWIVNMASIFGHVGTKDHAAYVSSKHLVMGLTRAAALDCAKHIIHVNAICPGSPFLTDNPGNIAYVTATQPLRGIGHPNDLARVAVFLASDDARWVTGQGICVDGGFLAQ